MLQIMRCMPHLKMLPDIMYFDRGCVARIDGFVVHMYYADMEFTRSYDIRTINAEVEKYEEQYMMSTVNIGYILHKIELNELYAQ
jgi:hypothetical protein